MKKHILWLASLSLLFLSGCKVPDSAYYQNYKKDYIYSVEYHGYRPFDWGEGYYATYGNGTKDWVTQPRADYVKSAYVLSQGCDVRH